MEKLMYDCQNFASNPLVDLDHIEIDDNNVYTLIINKPEIEDMQDDYVHTKKYIPFLDEHPLSATHVVKCDLDRMQTIIPNFIGSPLHCCDQGDREIYCCTMLTLFKPWRTGGDLKIYGQSWNDAYDIYDFCDWHRKLMKNFNLRYECLDSQDDFHTELKKKTK